MTTVLYIINNTSLIMNMMDYIILIMNARVKMTICCHAIKICQIADLWLSRCAPDDPDFDFTIYATKIEAEESLK